MQDLQLYAPLRSRAGAACRRESALAAATIPTEANKVRAIRLGRGAERWSHQLRLIPQHHARLRQTYCVDIKSSRNGF